MSASRQAVGTSPSARGGQHRKRQPNRFIKFLKTPKGIATWTLILIAAIALFAAWLGSMHGAASTATGAASSHASAGAAFGSSSSKSSSSGSAGATFGSSGASGIATSSGAAGTEGPALLNTLVAVVTGILVDYVASIVYRRPKWFSDGGIVTGLIVGLVLSTATPWYVVATTVVIGLIAKHLIKLRRKPMFNPAAFGLFVSSLVFASMQSWWGGMSLVSNWYLTALVVIGAYVTWRVKKLPQVIAFLVAYVVLAGILMLVPGMHSEASVALQNPMLNSALFLAFFMLTDPPTTPSARRDQIWFGALTGLLSVGIYIVFPAELTYLLIALLVANVAKFIQAEVRRRATSAGRSVRTTVTS